MKVFLSVLIALGGVLPLSAAFWGWRLASREFGRLAHDLDAIDVIIETPDDAFASWKERAEAMYAIRQPKFNVGRLTYTYEWVQRMILEQALNDLKGPAWLGTAGIAIGTIGGVWALWI
ncbi:hypothetical protein POF50_019450 [Streptomyces sp. SL13]|uniref:Uncharacterized protein n=1 Tax=Streptantibioticus silvisoli TaxID=2705255 RepID=A0AA90HB41_9ACTN|nr:hypothetical protein [Streptantibioticus silvisoli]MDI5971482.1 hypothetical protein [Streptantibioticus silvisoli]